MDDIQVINAPLPPMYVPVVQPETRVISVGQPGPPGPTGLPGASASGAYEINFAYGDASPVAIITATAGKVVKEVQIHITTAFNGTGAALAVGDAGDTDRLFTASEVDVTQVGASYAHPAYAYGSDTGVKLYITPGSGASQGAGVVVVVLQG